MKKNRKRGFTLIELLAVIIVLAVIATIAVPSINNMIEKGKKDSLLASANGLYDSAKTYYMDYIMNNGELENDVTFDVTNISDVKLLSFNGQIPDNGVVYITKDGSVGISVTAGNYCAKKEMYESKITVSEGSDCEILDGDEFEDLASSCLAFDAGSKTITGYDFSNSKCPTDVVIPASIKGIPVEHIGDGAFTLGNGVFAVYYDSSYNYVLADSTVNESYYKTTYGYEIGMTFPINVSNQSLYKICVDESDNEVSKEFDFEITGTDYISCNIASAILEPVTGIITSVDFTLAVNLKTIGNAAFYGDKITSLNFGNISNLESIESSAFMLNYIDTSVDLSNLINLTSIGAESFASNNISEVILPDTKVEIETNAFAGNALESITIPANITEIGRGAFRDNNFVSVTIEGNNINTSNRFNDYWEDIGWPLELKKIAPVFYITDTIFDGATSIDTGYSLFDTYKDFTIITSFTSTKSYVNGGNPPTVFHCMYEASPYPGFSFDQLNTNGRLALKSNRTNPLPTAIYNNKNYMALKFVASTKKFYSYFYDSSGNLVINDDTSKISLTNFDNHLLIGAFQNISGVQSRYFVGTIHAFDLYLESMSDSFIEERLSEI